MMPSMHLAKVNIAFIAICAFTLFRPASAVLQTLCSSINNSPNQRNSSIYQSDGLCSDFCRSGYAYAIVQYQDCWCSDYTPTPLVSLDQCNQKCPGYPDELCGTDTLFGYILLDKTVAGTKGGSSVASTTASPRTTPKEVTVTASGRIVTVTAEPPSSSVASSSSSPVVSSTTSSTSSSSMTWTPTPIVSIVTVTGQVQTITYTPTTPPNSSANQSDLSKGGSNSLNTGQAVGLTFGLVALVVLISAIVFFCVRKRNKQKRREAEVEAAASAFSRSGSSQVGHIPQRTMSENSRFMLQTDGRQVVEGWESGESGGTPGSRVSRLLPVDPRLDPYAGVYQRGDGSKSRESVQTIQDNHDYSRRVLGQGPILRATNPD